MIKKIVIILFVLFCLLGCSDEKSPSEYLTLNLNSIYLNHHLEDLLTYYSSDISVDDLKNNFNENVTKESEFFLYYYDINPELLTAESLVRVNNMIKNIYAYSKFEIGDELKNEDTYLVTLKVYPINIFQKILTEENIEVIKYEMAEQSSLSEIELENMVLNELIDQILDHINDIEYLEAVDIEVSITKNGNYFVVNSIDVDEIDAAILAY